MTDNKNKVTSGSIVRTVFSLAIPVVLGMLMEFALSITDYFWVGKLGAVAQDAVMTSMVIIWAVFASLSLVNVGLTALVARYVGAGEFDRVVNYIKQGFALAVILGIVATSAGAAGIPYVLRFMDTPPESFAMALPYLRIFFFTSILFYLADTGYAVFRASGDTRTPTKVGLLVVAINMVLDPVLIFGWGVIPAYGVAGASLASAFAILIGAIIILLRLYKGDLSYSLSGFKKIRVKTNDILKIIKISLPMTAQQFVFIFVYWFLIKIVHEFGTEAAAAMGIGNRMESFSYLTCFGFSIAASTMVGQNLGAKLPDRAAKCAWGATGVAVGLSFIMSVFFILIPRSIATIFSDNPQVITIAVDYLIILGLSQMAMAIEIVLEGAFGGAGDTIPPMVVSIPFSALRVPLAYYLCFNLDWGINGVWWTLTITSLIKALTLGVWFKLGFWKRKQV